MIDNHLSRTSRALKQSSRASHMPLTTPRYIPSHPTSPPRKPTAANEPMIEIPTICHVLFPRTIRPACRHFFSLSIVLLPDLHECTHACMCWRSLRWTRHGMCRFFFPASKRAKERKRPKLDCLVNSFCNQRGNVSARGTAFQEHLTHATLTEACSSTSA